MDKDQLRQRIDKLPLFEKRRIKLCKQDSEDSEEFIEDDVYKAVCEVGQNDPHAFVTGSYNLLQFREIFEPILDSFKEEVEGNVIHYGGFAMITLFPDNEEMKEGKSKFGIIAMNSVDCSSSVIVKFCVEYEGRKVSIPPKIAGLKKQHTTRVGTVARDYIHFIAGVKEAWTKIIAEFPNYEVRDELKEGDENVIELGDAISNLKLGTRATKKIKLKMDAVTAEGKSFTLWDTFELALDRISDADYKSDVHKQRKLDALCQAVFDYALVLQI